MRKLNFKQFLFETLRGRLILGVALVHAAMMTIFVIDLTYRQKQMLLENQTDEAIAMSQSLATSSAGWIASNDLSGLAELVEAERRYPHMIFTIITNEHGKILAHTDKTKLGLYLEEIPDSVNQVILNKSAELVDVLVPAKLNNYHVGWVRIGVNQKTASGRLSDIIFMGIIYSIIAIIIGSFIAWIMGNLITKRLYAVQDTIRKVKAGDQSVRSDLDGKDEAASIAMEFNHLLDTLDAKEQALHLSESKYRILLLNIPAAVVVHTPDTRIVMCNPMAETILGLTEAQLKGKPANNSVWNFLREDGSPLPVNEYPVNQVINKNQGLRDMIMGVKNVHTQEIVWVLVNADPMFDNAGKIDEIIVTFIDITKRKIAEEQVNKLNRIYAVLSNINQSIVRIHNKQELFEKACQIAIDYGKFRMVWVGTLNTTSNKIDVVASAGVSGNYLEKINIDLNDAQLGNGPAGIAIKTEKYFVSNNIQNDEKMNVWREDAIKYGYKSVAAFPLIVFGKAEAVFLVYAGQTDFFDNDDINLLHETTMDISFALESIENENIRRQTEENLIKAKEKAEEANLLKTAFLHNISHEVRTPMNAICGFSEFLNYPDLTEEKRISYISIIQNSSNQLLSIINDILTISSLETKQETLNLQATNINHIIYELYQIFLPQAINHNLSLYAKPHLVDEKSIINTDKTKLSQILSNLISNAIKFTHQGYIEFGYVLDNNYLEFYIKDTGIGISTEMREKIFEHFRQADHTIHVYYGGTGLGLSISKGFVEMLGGKIWVQSDLGMGSTFYFTIPYKPIKPLDTKIPNDLSGLQLKTILVAEDEKYNFLFIEEILKNKVLKLIHTLNGQETLDECKENQYIDLILMDIKMPGMDGFEAAKLIKLFRPNLPIIAVSAYAMEDEKAKYENTFDDYLTKPVKETELLQRILKYVQTS